MAPTLAALWAVGYLAVFLATPTRDSPDVPRGSYLLAALLRPDDIVTAWFAGLSWTSLGQRAAILLTVLGVLAVAAAAGWICLRLARVDRLVTRLEMTLLATGLGLNLVSLATLCLGLAGLLRFDLFIALGVLVCVTAAAMRRMAGCESGTCSLRREMAAGEAEVWNWSPYWLWLLIPFTLAILGAAMMPPLDFDVREYHLQAPKEFYQAGEITFLPHNVYANMPLGTEMLALAGMVVTDDWWTGALVGKAAIGMFAPLAALLLYAAGCRLASPAAGIVAAIVFISLPWVAIVSSHGLVEGAFAFYLFAALYLVIVWQRELSNLAADEKLRRAATGLLGTAGFLAGAAVATKYPAVLYCALPLTAYVAVVALQREGLRRACGGVGIFVLGIAFGCGLWFLKNAVLTGNPTYPLLYSIFGGETWTPSKELQWQAAHRPPGYELSDLLRRAKELALSGTWISPLVVPLCLLAFFSPPKRRLAGLLTTAIVFIWLAWWLLTHRIDRFLVPMWPLAALLAGLGATWNASKAWRYSLAGLLALGLTYDFLVIAGGPVSDNRYFMPLTVLREESVRLDPWHAYLNQHVRDVSGVLLVGDAQPFDLEVPAQYNTVFDNSIFEDLASGRTPEQVREALLARGISHVYVSWPEIERYRSPGNYGITEFLQPRIFAELVAAGVLEQLPQLADHGGEMFRVRSVIAR